MAGQDLIPALGERVVLFFFFFFFLAVLGVFLYIRMREHDRQGGIGP